MKKQIVFRAWLFICLLAAVFASHPAAYAQEGKIPIGNQWSVPLRIPDYDNEAYPPYLVADTNRTIHAFASLNTGRTTVITHSQWTQANGWTSPTDIFLSPWMGEVRIQGAFLDQEGWIHLLYFSGNDLAASYFHSKAPVMNAGIASAWTTPRLIGENAITPTVAALGGDGKGNLYAVFSGSRDGTGLYAVYSDDSGETWNEPVTLWLTKDDTSRPGGLRLHVDPQGTLHTVWARGNQRGLGEEVFYAQLGADNIWTNPLVLATRTEGDYKADWPTIISYNDELFVVYQDSFPATRWMRRSKDNGQTWSNPVRPFNYVGEYAHVAFVIDSNNYLHMLLGNRTMDEVHGMWHSVWLGDRWSDQEPIISGPKTPQFDPSAPRATIVQGNTIMVTWWTDTGGQPRNGVWYSYTTLDAPELPVQPPPTPKPKPTATPWAVLSNTGGQVPPPESPNLELIQAMDTEPQPIQSPSIVILAALIPSALLVLVVVLIYGRRLSRN